MINPIKNIIYNNGTKIQHGIPSFCSSNPLVIESVLEYAKINNEYALIESTANQVNQDGGYSGMKPEDFRNLVFGIADNIGFPKEKIILGGDHLGPLVWSNLSSDVAMEKAKELVKLYIAAGYKKIHLDASMYLGDDSRKSPLSTETIVKRGVVLYQTCEKEYQKLLLKNPDEIPIAYVIGSEVPIPGGNFNSTDGLHITTPDDFKDMIETYDRIFLNYGCRNAWESIIAVVIEPGVEFSNNNVIQYNHENTKYLKEELKKYPSLVFEGHSTDYQSYKSLKEMVTDGIVILKVGPALTFTLRESLYSLALIENELVNKNNASDFINSLDKVMLKNPVYWEKYYYGPTSEKAIFRKYGLSDRCRYYLSNDEILAVINKLFDNIDSVNIPLGLLHQYMPNQYEMVMNNGYIPTARELVKLSIIKIIEQYYCAANISYN